MAYTASKDSGSKDICCENLVSGGIPVKKVCTNHEIALDERELIRETLLCCILGCSLNLVVVVI